MQLHDRLATVRGEPVTVGDTLVQLKVKGQFRVAIYELIERRVIEEKCRERALDIGDAEFQKRRTARRRALGLEDPSRLQTYLRQHGVTYDQWSDHVRGVLLKEMLRDAVVTDEQVSRYFDANRVRFETVPLARIVCGARSAIEQVAEELSRAGDFFDLAIQYSRETGTRVIGGYIGEVRRGMLPPDVEKSVFLAEPRDVVGPFVEGATWTLYKVLAKPGAELTRSLRQVLRDQIFGEWLRHEVYRVPA